MLMLWFAAASSAAECGPAGCPIPRQVADDGGARASGEKPPIDRAEHHEIRIATFALG